MKPLRGKLLLSPYLSKTNEERGGYGGARQRREEEFWSGDPGETVLGGRDGKNNHLAIKKLQTCPLNDDEARRVNP